MLISTPAEARHVLAKDDFSVEDARSLCQYLMQRDNECREQIKIIGGGSYAQYQILDVVLTALIELPVVQANETLLATLKKHLASLDVALDLVLGENQSS